MPAAPATLRRVRCRATSRDSTRCRRWCPPGSTVCHAHGAASPRVRAAAEAREVLAEVEAAWPSRSPREVLLTAVSIVDQQQLDLRAQAPAGRSLDAAERAELIEAAHRAALLAKAALDANVTVDAAEVLEQERGADIAAVLGRVGEQMLISLRSSSSDFLALQSWLQRAVPQAIRGQELEPCPRAWVAPVPLPSSPMLESADVVKARAEAEQARLVREALGVPESAVEASGQRGNTTSSVNGAPRHERRGSRGQSEPSESVAEQERRFVEANGLAARSWPRSSVFQ